MENIQIPPAFLRTLTDQKPRGPRFKPLRALVLLADRIQFAIAVLPRRSRPPRALLRGPAA